MGSGTGLRPPPDNSKDRRSGGEAALHRARASTRGTQRRCGEARCGFFLSPPPAQAAGRGRGWGLTAPPAASPRDPPPPTPPRRAQVRGREGRRRPRRIPAARIRAGQLRHLRHHSHARSGTGKTARLHHRGGRPRRAGAAAAQQDGGARRRRHRRRAGKPDPRRPARIQGRGRPGQDLDAASPAAPGKIRRRRPLRDQVRIRAEGRPAHRDQGTGRGHRAQRPHPGAARRHRLRQDLHHGQGDRGDAAPRHHSRAEQDAGGAALWRVQELLSRQRRRVFCLLLRLLPARGLCAADRHLHREGFLHQRADRPHAPFGDAGAAGARRRHHRRLGVVHLRYRLGRDLHRDDLCAEEGRAHRPAAADRRSGGAAVQAHAGRFHPRHLSGARRRHRHLPGPL